MSGKTTLRFLVGLSVALALAVLAMPHGGPLVDVPDAWATATATPTPTPTPTVTPTPTPTPHPGDTTGVNKCVSVSSLAQTQVLPQVQVRNGRSIICIQDTETIAAAYVACNIGNTTPVTISTGMIFPAQSATSAFNIPPLCIWPMQTSSRTIPMVPSGPLNCIANAGNPNVCVYDP